MLMNAASCGAHPSALGVENAAIGCGFTSTSAVAFPVQPNALDPWYSMENVAKSMSVLLQLCVGVLSLDNVPSPKDQNPVVALFISGMVKTNGEQASVSAKTKLNSGVGSTSMSNVRSSVHPRLSIANSVTVNVLASSPAALNS